MLGINAQFNEKPWLNYNILRSNNKKERQYNVYILMYSTDINIRQKNNTDNRKETIKHSRKNEILINKQSRIL